MYQASNIQRNYKISSPDNKISMDLSVMLWGGKFWYMSNTGAITVLYSTLLAATASANKHKNVTELDRRPTYRLCCIKIVFERKSEKSNTNP